MVYKVLQGSLEHLFKSSQCPVTEKNKVMTFQEVPELVSSSLHTSALTEWHGDSTCSSGSSCTQTPTKNSLLEHIWEADAPRYFAKKPCSVTAGQDSLEDLRVN